MYFFVQVSFHSKQGKVEATSPISPISIKMEYYGKWGYMFFSRSTNMSSLKSGHMGYM